MTNYMLINKTPLFKQGFSLAEILLVITIIGIATSLTIPEIVINIQKSINETRFKNTYSQFVNVFNKIKEDDGGSLTFLPDGTTEQRDAAFIEQLKTYLNIIKVNPYGDTNNSSVIGSPDEECRYLTGDIVPCSDLGVTEKASTSIIIADGSAMQFKLLNSTAFIFFDTNGNKQPNVYGKDIFNYYLRADGTLTEFPQNFNCKTGVGLYGFGCGAAILSGNYNPN